MAIRLSRFVGAFLMLMLCLSATLSAQEYCVTIHFPEGTSGRVDCRFFSNDTLPQRRFSTLRDGEAIFKGTASQPHLVEVSHPDLPSPVVFFLENANINVDINIHAPSASRITGSRINSEYRYALEDWNGDVLQFVAAHSSSIFSPYLLYAHLSELDAPSIQKALSLIKGPAAKTYHYRQLVKRLSTILATTEGERMPDFEYVDDNKKPIHFDSVRVDTLPSIILFTATYSQRGTQAAQQIRRDYPQLRLHVINIDKHPRFWDAPYLELLAVDRIPYMILLAPQGIIHTRDARLWELPRLLSTLPDK